MDTLERFERVHYVPPITTKPQVLVELIDKTFTDVDGEIKPLKDRVGMIEALPRWRCKHEDTICAACFGSWWTDYLIQIPRGVRAVFLLDNLDTRHFAGVQHEF